MKKLFLLLLFFGFCGSAQAADIWFKQVASGAGTGATCTDARALSSHAIGDDVAGNIMHLCPGTFTGSQGATGFTFLASGSVGNPITLIFESGAVMSSPQWNAAINDTGKSNIVIDGGTNGIIQNTLAGTSGAACLGGPCSIPNPLCSFNSSNCAMVHLGGNFANVEVKNLHVTNMYVRTTLTPNGNGLSAKAIYVEAGTQSGLLIHDNTVVNAHSGIFISYCGLSSVQIYNNTTSNHVWGVGILDDNPGCTATDVQIHDNNISEFLPWAAPNGGDVGFHFDGIITAATNPSTSFTNLSIYNNFLGGKMDVNGTGYIFLTGSSGGLRNNILVYNNVIHGVFPANGNGNQGPEAMIVDGFDSFPSIYNNTLISCDVSDGLRIRDPGTGLAAFKNNIIQGDTCGTLFVGINNITQADLSGTKVSNNDYFNLNPSHMFQKNGFANSYTSLAAWQAAGACNCDANSTSGNPNLSSTFVPQSPSVAIGAGLNLTSLLITPLDSDNVGNARPSSGAWTIGALNSNSGTAQAVLTPSSNNFGSVVQHVTSSPVTFTLTNPAGTANLILSSPCCSTSGTNGPDFVISAKTCTDGQVIRPALDSCTMSVTFTPNIVGTESGVLQTGGNAKGTAALSGTGTAPATAAVNITPNPIPFPNTTVGATSSPATITTVTNTGLANLVLNNPTYVTVSPAGEFVVTGGTCGPGSVVTPSTNCTILGTFTPSAAGARSATLAVLGNASGSATLNGLGVAPTSPQLTITPTSFNFGNQLKGARSAVKSFTISSTGTADATGVSFSFTGGSNPADFSQTSTTCGTTIAAGTNCTLSVIFTPSTAAFESGGVNVLSNAPTVNSSLSGTGIFPIITCTPNPLPFGSFNQGTSSPGQVVTCKNTGTAPLTFGNPAITFTGVTAPYFTVSAQTCTNNSALAINATCTATVVFTPGSAGSFTDTFVANAFAGSFGKLYNLVGSIAATTISYSMISSNPAGTTASWSMPVHPVPASSTIINGDFNLGNNFQFPTPTGFLFNSSAVSPLSLVFYSTSNGGGVSAFFSGLGGYFITDFSPQLYSGAENAPTMLAGTFTLADVNNTIGTALTGSLTMTGTGILVAPVITLTPRPAVFPGQLTGVTSPSVPVTVTNSGNAIETFSTTTITTGDSGDFVKVAGGTCGATLAAGNSCTMLFTFTPSGTPRVEQTLLTVNGTATATVTLQGQGLPSGTGGAPVPLVIATQIDLFPGPRVSVVGKNFLVGKTQITIDGVAQVPACDTTTHCGVTLPASAVLLPGFGLIGHAIGVK